VYQFWPSIGDVVLWFSIIAILNLIFYEFFSTVRWSHIDRKRFSSITFLTGTVAIILLLLYGLKQALK